MDLTKQLENLKMYIDSMEDAIHEIIILRNRVAELETAQRSCEADSSTTATEQCLNGCECYDVENCSCERVK